MALIGESRMTESFVYGERFCYDGFCYFLQKCQYDSDVCKELLCKVGKAIDGKYQHYFRSYTSEENREFIPILLAYSIFEYEVERETELCDTSTCKRKHVEVRNFYF